METPVLQPIDNGAATICGEWYPLERLKRENQKILVWIEGTVQMANAYRGNDDRYFWSRVKAWMPFPEPPQS